MGNNDSRSVIRFRQSPLDFPCMVSLGEQSPSWGISRWHSPGLRFFPEGEEGFTLRGDRRHRTGASVVYRGKRRSHRFTILGDHSFEYDCILNREPESNTIMVRLEGADRFDFFRQPDWLKNPLLAGSYAVYKKETFAGEGTGKLCHIHRPKIMDAAGRWVWGDLSINGEQLGITIPEGWLSEARYPVIVDPVIGTTTVGSQTHWESDPGEPAVPLTNEMCMPVNRFLVSQTINGLCTAYFYVYSSEEQDSGGYPVLYADNGNKPLARQSAGEQFIDLRVNGGSPAGWRSGTFQSKNIIAGGSYVWFGLSTEYFWFSRFDYGLKCYRDNNYDGVLPDTYPLYNANYYDNFKLSMYFEYSSAENYTRTLTQGVTLTDSRKGAAAYYRTHTTGVQSTDMASRFKGFFRAVTEQLKTNDFVSCCRGLLRSIANMVRPSAGETRKLEVKRGVSTQALITDTTARERGFIRTLLMAVHTADYAGKVFTWLRVIHQQADVVDQTGRRGDYLRGLYTEAGSRAETIHAGEYYRLQQDHVSTQALSLRHLIIFIRLVTVGFIRDYLIPRFLRSKEELVLKSKVSRELELDSKV